MNVFTPSDFSILMVDDTPKNLQLLGNYLNGTGYKIEFATSGIQAIEWIKRKKFDLILLDIMMPEMSGFQVCKTIRENTENNDLPIIFLTAKTDKESILQGFRYGGQDYITKPFDPSELLARVKTHLELKDSREKLKKMNVWLEKEVAKRTKEIKEVNIKLEKANAELHVLDKAKSDFLRVISHEIRTPLNGIITPIQILQEKLSDTNVGNYIKVLDESVSRLEKFSYIALYITDLRMGNYELLIDNMNVKEIIKSTINKSAKLFTSKEIDVKFSFTNKTESFGIDKDLIKMAINCVFDNAIKYSPEKGVIKISSFEKNDYLIISFTDQGPGFSDESINNLFNLFSNADKHIDNNEGLELALVKLIMNAHNGDIQVNNSKKGATVQLKFPLYI